MTQPITNYTTYDQAYHYADLKHLPRLSEEDRRSFITRPPTADVRLTSSSSSWRATYAEIVRLLGIRRTEVQRLTREALIRLRAFVEGKATLVQRSGKLIIDYPAVHNRLRIPPEQVAALSATCRALQAQGVAVTIRALAQAAGVSQSRAQQFLHQQRDQFPAGLASKAERHQQRLAHVAAIYAEHLAHGQPVTSSTTLARAAHVRIETALEFLRIERGKSQ